MLSAALWIGTAGCGDEGSASGGTDGGSSGGAQTSTAAGSSSATVASTGEPATGSTGGTGSTEDTGADASSSSTGEPGACATDVEPSDTVVLTEHGPVEGAPTEEGPVAFLGIPYAAPPVEALRFMLPQAPACWTERLDATERGPVCPQLEGPEGPVVGDEDCLQLNVWTPAADEGARPVLVFIHGGGNAVGSGADPLYDGAKLAAAGDQIVITVNYRLGALGWLTHPDLPGVNFGLRDQIAALQWVQANAAAFGGDPQRVTVFGESAGAVNTCTLLGAPEAAGLLHGAIVQSGACTHRSPEVYAEQTSTPFMEASGCAEEDDPIDCLRGLPTEVVVSTAPTGFPSVAGLGGQGWGPSVDPDRLPQPSIDAMGAGVHNDVPLIIGANEDETYRDAPQIPDAASYEALISGAFGPLADLVLAQYPAQDYPSPRDAYVALTTDVKFVCTARNSLRAASNGRSPVYRYHFTHDDYFAPGGGDTSAFHGLELLYIFGNFEEVIPGFDYPATEADEAVRDAMQALWSSFAAQGAPQGEPAWPAYDVDSDPYLEIGSPLVTGQGVRTEQCDFWAQFTGG